MSAINLLHASLQRARRHRALELLLRWLPWWVLAAALGWRFGGSHWVAWVPLPVLLGVGGWEIARRLRALDSHWLAQRLDATRTDMQDSTGLLLGLQPARTPLQQLQRSRIEQQLQARGVPDVRIPWRRRALWWSALLALPLIAVALLGPQIKVVVERDTATSQTPSHSGEQAPRLIASTLRIEPPAYTGLPAREQTTLATRVPAGTRLRWTLQFEPQAGVAALGFLDGKQLKLQRQADGRWTGEHMALAPALYRVLPEQSTAEGKPALHRIDVIADRPPQVKQLQPTSTLTMLAPGQRSWTLEFEATDDYGVAATASLRITRTQGSGENITASERRIAITGSGAPRARRFRHTFDLAALGLVAGNDLIVRLDVRDQRSPQPHTASSASVILRVPPQATDDATGIEGLAKKAMPAYFRSQRQIIIDIEELLKQKPRLGADEFARRSDAIGVDQRLLRLRYGQFLGEESEGGGGGTLPVNDADAAAHGDHPGEAPAAPAAATTKRSSLPIDDGQPASSYATPPAGAEAPAAAASEPAATATDAGSDDDTHAPGEDDHAHGDGAPQRAAVFGEEQQVLERFGHTHDIPEAATLLDPKTREVLRSALNAMWDSELQLRQGHPKAALPHANRALALIKQVQQAERIYLGKVGSELPPLDFSRRMQGKREGLGNRSSAAPPAVEVDTTAADAWRTLGDTGILIEQIDLPALQRWAASHAQGRGDPLALAAALDALQRDPACASCRQQLRAQLWPLLAVPPAAPQRRAAVDASGRAYLDALRQAQAEGDR